MDNRVYWLWTALVFGAGSRRLWETADKDCDPEKLCRDMMAGKVGGLTDAERQKAGRIKPDDAESLLNEALGQGQQVVCIDDDAYPERLRRLDDAPAVLFCQGDTGLLNDRAVVHIVGSRQPTRYTSSLIAVLCRELVLRGFVLSSGFAEGADAQVIENTLRHGGAALTVYPTSAEQEYPKGSQELKERLVSGGLLISEHAPNKRGGMNFHKRNRLAVALSSAVIVAEASAESKGLDNCEWAEKLGVPVFAVPPHLLYSTEYYGQRDLLRKGCVPLFDGADVVRVLEERGDIPKGSHKLAGAAAGSARTAAGDDSTARSVKKPAQEKAVKQRADISEMKVLTPDERVVCELLRENGELSMDELIMRSGFDMIKILPCVTGLELDGIVSSLPGKRYKLN